MAIPTDTILLIARICLVGMFPFSAVDKIIHWKNALAQTRSSGLPGGPVMLVAAILVEAVTPVCVVFDVYARVAALLLAGFCVVTAFLYHPFWKGPDFWSPRDASVARGHFWEFLKNFGLVGGLLLLVFLAPQSSVSTIHRAGLDAPDASAAPGLSVDPKS